MFTGIFVLSVPPEGGFGHGAIMSYSIGLLNPNEVKGVIAFSSRLLEPIKPKV